MSIVLYWHPMSSATPIACALTELAVPHERVKIDIRTGEQRRPEYLAMNPNGKVPTLTVDGAPMFEALAIHLWLGHRFGIERGLWPAAGTPEALQALRAQAQTVRLGDEAIALLNYVVLAWLAHSPSGRLSFSLCDPVGLGESFAGLMHLADYEDVLINTKIRTQSDQIERRLGELCDHMEKVIQMYLRNEYEDITAYNEKAGTIAEKYGPQTPGTKTGSWVEVMVQEDVPTT